MGFNRAGKTTEEKRRQQIGGGGRGTGGRAGGRQQERPRRREREGRGTGVTKGRGQVDLVRGMGTLEGAENGRKDAVVGVVGGRWESAKRT